MSTLLSNKVQSVLKRLHEQARVMDEPLLAQFDKMSVIERRVLQKDYTRLYGMAKDAYLSVGEGFGRMLYLLARSSKARSVVEFGTSFGISTIYLASALRDNGGGKLITCELEPAKSQKAQSHLTEAGLADLVEFRVGDGLKLFRENMPATVDFLLLDGAKPLYLHILQLLEPSLKSGALIASDNINEQNHVEEFTEYIRDPANGYLSVDMPLEDGIEISMRI